MNNSWWKIGVGIVLAGQGMLLGLAVNLSDQSETSRFVLQSVILLATLAVVGLLGGRLVEGLRASIRSRRLNMECLFLVALCGAMGVSLQSYLTGEGAIYFEVVSILLVIYAFNDQLRTRARTAAVAATGRWLKQLGMARRSDDDDENPWVSIAEIETGDRVEIHPGELITVDGRIVQGQAFVYETSLTGEPYPCVKKPGDVVSAGSIVEDATLIVQATVPGRSRKIDGLLAALREARGTTISLQKQIDRWTQFFLPTVLLIALATFGYWASVSGWEAALFHGMSVLLVACPCALGLAAPLAIWTSMTQLAERGLIVHQADFIVRLASVKHAIFDKTGTLTEDAATVQSVVTASHIPRTKLLSWLASVERQSRHPIARAFAKLDLDNPRKVSQMRLQTHPGRGLEARFTDCCGESHHMRVGTREWINPVFQNELSEHWTIDREDEASVFVEVDDRMAAVCQLSERARHSAEFAIQELKSLGLQVTILSGDRLERAEAIGFPNALGRQSPLEKLQFIERLESNGTPCLFVGDGINDAAALQHASVSIAMASGAEVAEAHAQATLLSGDLTAVPEGIRLSRRALRLIRSNLLWAASYNAVGIGLAATGVLHPVAAALLMIGSSLFVTVRSIDFAERSRDVSAVPPVSPNLHLTTSDEIKIPSSCCSG